MAGLVLCGSERCGGLPDDQSVLLTDEYFSGNIFI